MRKIILAGVFLFASLLIVQCRATPILNVSTTQPPLPVATVTPVSTVTPTGTQTPNIAVEPAPVPPTPTPRPTPTPIPWSQYASIEHNITYCTVDGEALKLDLYFPKTPSTQPMPVLINIHGGSWSFGSKTDSETRVDIPSLVEQGFVVAGIDYRLAPAHKFPAQIEDVKCAIRFLRAHAAQYHLDVNHFGAWGCSAGGHLVALAAVADQRAGFDVGEYANQSSRLQAVVPISAPEDLALYNATARADMLLRVFNIQTTPNPMLADASPIHYVTKDAPPFLIIQGDHDNIVIPAHAESMLTRLNAVHVPAQLVLVKNGHHCLPTGNPPPEPSRSEITKKIVDFFDQTLRH